MYACVVSHHKLPTFSKTISQVLAGEKANVFNTLFCFAASWTTKHGMARSCWVGKICFQQRPLEWKTGERMRERKPTMNGQCLCVCVCGELENDLN